MKNGKSEGKKKILICYHSSQFGGVEKQILDIVECESKHYDIFVMVPDGPLVKEYIKAGAQHVNLYPKSEYDLGYSYKIAKFCKKNNIHAIHGHELKVGSLSVFGGFLGRVEKRILHVHTPFVEWKHSSTKRLFALTVNTIVNFIVANFFATHVLALTESIKQIRHQKEFVFNRKIVVIPNGLKLDDFEFDTVGRKKIRKSYNIGDKDFVFGYVARLTEEKGHSYLIRAFSEFKKMVDNKSIKPDIRNRIKNSKLILAGGGKLENDLKKLVNDLNLDGDVIITGRFADEDKIPLYSSFDTFTFASYTEGFGIVLIEAMAMGLPVIASDIPVLHDVGGDAVKYAIPDDIDDWKLEMLRFIQDDKLRKELSLNSTKQAQRFSMKRFCENYKNLYS